MWFLIIISRGLAHVATPFAPHPLGLWMIYELRQRKWTLWGRAKLRQRTTVEHSLTHIGRWQGDHVRFRGVRKDLFDLRCCAVVHNLPVIAHLPAFTPPA